MNFTKKIFLSSVYLFFLSTLSAQTLRDVQILEDQKLHPAIEIKLNGQPDQVKKSFKNHLMEQFDVKLDGYGFLTNRDVLEAEAVSFSAVSDKRMDFFAEIIAAPEPNQTRMRVYADFGYNIPLSREVDGQAYQRLKGILGKYVDQYNRSRLDTQTEKVEALVEERDDLATRKADLLEELRATEKELKQLQQDIRVEEAEMADLRRQIQSRIGAESSSF